MTSSLSTMPTALSPYSLIVKRRKLERDVAEQGMSEIKFELSRAMDEIIRREKRQSPSTTLDENPTAFTRIVRLVRWRETHISSARRSPIVRELETDVQVAVARAKKFRVLHSLADSALITKVAHLEQKQALTQRAVDLLLAELLRIDDECTRRGINSSPAGGDESAAGEEEEEVEEKEVVEKVVVEKEVEVKQTQQQTEEAPPRERNDQSGRDFFSKPPCSTFRDAALRLLCSQFTEGDEGHTSHRTSATLHRASAAATPPSC